MRPVVLYAVGLLLVVASGCSALVGGDQQTILCHATKEPVQCAPEGDVPRAYRVFNAYVGPIEPELPLIVHWYDWDHIFEAHDPDDSDGDAAGWADLNTWPYELHVRNTGVFMHELNHVSLLEATGYADSNHEEPGEGAWGEAHNAAIEVAADVFGTTNGTPCPPEVCPVAGDAADGGIEDAQD